MVIICSIREFGSKKIGHIRILAWKTEFEQNITPNAIEEQYKVLHQQTDFNPSDTTKQQIFDIYTNVALVDKGVQGDKVTADYIKYYLWPTNKAENYSIVNSTTINSLITGDALYIFFIHGWTESRETKWYELLRNAFFKRNPHYYIIEVDWSVYAEKDYVIASYDTKFIGGFIGEFVVYLRKNFAIPLANILVVGHSLGGHISGFVGKKVQEMVKEKLPRIIALDPAGPLFENRPEGERLSPKDAVVVHVIHTNGGAFGFLEACGTIDFFPNNGTFQSGCGFQSFLSPCDIREKVFCSHWRSWGYFIEGISTTKKFRARKCDNWRQYTRHACEADYETIANLETNKTGKYYLRTNNKPPYSK
ncbi:phospholipase A1-like [Zophobas morio]|uniref:phospholipase A1-like n=1 Tax=Zophobas morio TaxID=2755281 RepID=UPI0030836165